MAACIHPPGYLTEINPSRTACDRNARNYGVPRKSKSVAHAILAAFGTHSDSMQLHVPGDPQIVQLLNTTTTTATATATTATAAATSTATLPATCQTCCFTSVRDEVGNTEEKALKKKNNQKTHEEQGKREARAIIDITQKTEPDRH